VLQPKKRSHWVKFLHLLPCLWIGSLVTVHGFRGSEVQGSATPLAAEAASLIEKETSALRHLVRGLKLGGLRFEVGGKKQ
jgi:hypothetical protein